MLHVSGVKYGSAYNVARQINHTFRKADEDNPVLTF
jgi:hypothetical protein